MLFFDVYRIAPPPFWVGSFWTIGNYLFSCCGWVLASNILYQHSEKTPNFIHTKYYSLNGFRFNVTVTYLENCPESPHPTLLLTMHTAQCIQCTVHHVLCTTHCTAHCAPFTTHCTCHLLCTVHCTTYTTHRTQCTMHHSTVNIHRSLCTNYRSSCTGQCSPCAAPLTKVA